MIYLLLDSIKDKYILENFKKIQAYFNRDLRAQPMPVYSNATRPVRGLIRGDTIYNSDDNTLNIWDGSNWRLPDGTIT